MMLTCGLCIFILFYIGKVKCVLVQQNVALFANKSDSTEIKCSHNDSSMLNMLWYQQKDTAMALIGNKYATGDPSYETDFEDRFKLEKTDKLNGSLKISDLSQSDSAVYYCAVSTQGGTYPAYFGSGTKLTVLDPAISKSEPIVKILNATKKESCKKKITLVCLANNFYPDHVKVAWFVGQQEITEDVATDPHATLAPSGGLYTISSRLKVSQKMWKKPTNKFTCKVSYYNGSFTSEHSDFVYGVAGGYDRDSYVKSSQWMKLAYGVTIAKSGLYGLVIFVFVWRKGSNGK